MGSLGKVEKADLIGPRVGAWKVVARNCDFCLEH